MIAMKLKKDLGLLEVFCISSGAMISSGLFVLPGLAYAYSGPGLILAYLILTSSQGGGRGFKSHPVHFGQQEKK